jgi:hypothetical protein
MGRTSSTNTLKTWERLLMEMTGIIVLMGGTRALGSVSPPMGVGMADKIGDRSVAVVSTAMGTVLQVKIVEVEEVMITGTMNAIWGRPRLSQPPVTQRAKRVKGKTPGTLHTIHLQMHQGMSQPQVMMTFP